MTTNLDHLAEAVATRLRRTGHMEMLTRRDQFRLAVWDSVQKPREGSLPYFGGPADDLRYVADMADCLMADDPAAEWEKRRPRVEQFADSMRRSREVFNQVTRGEFGTPWVRPDGTIVFPPGSVVEMDAHGRVVATQIREPTPPPGGETEARDASSEDDDPGPGHG